MTSEQNQESCSGASRIGEVCSQVKRFKKGELCDPLQQHEGEKDVLEYSSSDNGRELSSPGVVGENKVAAQLPLYPVIMVFTLGTAVTFL